MKGDLIQISLDDDDEPVLKFSASETEKTLETKMLGAFLRKVQRLGIECHLAKTYKDSDDTVHYDYEIRAKRHETDQGTTAGD